MAAIFLDSDYTYPGMSHTIPFKADEPYVVHPNGTDLTVSLWGKSRAHDFSGVAPWINPITGGCDVDTLRAQGASISYADVEAETNPNGIVSRVTREAFGTVQCFVNRYVANDVITVGKCRSQLESHAIPTRCHVRWEGKVSFGGTGADTWTHSAGFPVLFWQIYNSNMTSPPLAMEVDTSVTDGTKLTLSLNLMKDGDSFPNTIASYDGIPTGVLIPYTIEAWLDERTAANGGKGAIKATFNGVVIYDGNTNNIGSGLLKTWWDITMYRWNNPTPLAYNTTIFHQIAKFFVLPNAAASASNGWRAWASTPIAQSGSAAAVALDMPLASIMHSTAGAKTLALVPGTGIGAKFRRLPSNISQNDSFSATVAIGDTVDVTTTNNAVITSINWGSKGLNGTASFAGSTLTGLTTFLIGTNAFVGPLPVILPYAPGLTQYQVNSNAFSGTIPAMGTRPNLTIFNCQINNLTGAIPDLSGCTALTTFQCHVNAGINAWTGGTVAFTLGNFVARQCTLTAAAVNAILAAFVLAGRTSAAGTCVLSLEKGNAAPTGQGLTDKTTLIGRGWTVTTS